MSKNKNTKSGKTDSQKEKNVSSWDSYSVDESVEEEKDEDGDGDEGTSIFSDDEYDAQEQAFHKEQEKLFKQMSQHFALGKDQAAIQLREKLKENISKEYQRLVSKLDYTPPRLPEIKEEIKEEMKKLEKSLEEHDRSQFNELSEKLWDLRYEMEDVSKMMEKKREATEKKIEGFKQKYGNLVPNNGDIESTSQ